MQTRRVVSGSLIGWGLLAGSGVAAAADTETPRPRETQGSVPAPGDAETREDEPGRYTPAPKVSASGFQLGIGAGLVLGLGEVWEGRGDTIGSSGEPVLVDLSITPAYRVARDFALGIRAGVGVDPGSRGTVSSDGESVSIERRLWHASAMGRYQAAPGRGWYATLSLGAAAMVDSRGNASVSQWAPLLDAAAGYDLSIARPLSLGFELRAAYADFGEASRISPALSYDYDVSTWIGAGVVASVLP
ncbi:MAG TPA: hypothetical protein VMG12_17600 [Polyangiaceae bacterium]|nr:hypothetical protein [Polyangiaceae bacterium]